LESIDEKRFLDFRLKAANLKDRDTEHHQYKTELEIIKNYHGENSEIGEKAISWLKQFKAGVLIYSTVRHQLPCWLRLVAGKVATCRCAHHK
jgi:hypothetical protein